MHYVRKSQLNLGLDGAEPGIPILSRKLELNIFLGKMSAEVSAELGAEVSAELGAGLDSLEASPSTSSIFTSAVMTSASDVDIDLRNEFVLLRCLLSIWPPFSQARSRSIWKRARM